MKKLSLILIIALAAYSTNAQSFNFATSKKAKHIFYLESGVEYGLVAKVGYARSTRILGRPLIWTTDATLPFLQLDLHDYKLRSGLQVPVFSIAAWKTSANAAFILRGMETDYNTSFNLGYDIGIKTGFYKPTFFIAAEAGFDHALASHITNSDFYRDHYYADAKDGWYGTTGGNIYYGLSGGFNLKRSAISYRLGKVVDQYFESPNDFSAYFMLGYRVRL